MEIHPSIQIIAKAAKRAESKKSRNDLDSLCALWAHFMAGRTVCDWRGNYYMLHRVEVSPPDVSIIGVRLGIRGLPIGAEVKVPQSFIVLQGTGC